MQKLCGIHGRRGLAYEVGLGFYAFLRFHVDTSKYRRWNMDPAVASHCPPIVRPPDLASVGQPAARADTMTPPASTAAAASLPPPTAATSPVPPPSTATMPEPPTTDPLVPSQDPLVPGTDPLAPPSDPLAPQT